MKKMGLRLLGLSAIFLLFAQATAGIWTGDSFLYKPSLGARGEAEKNTFDSGLDRVDARLGKEKWVGDPSLGNTIDYYDSDWGMLELHMTKWNAHPNFTTSGTATISAWRGYFLNPARWSWLWNQKPTVYKPEFRGGSYKAAIDAIIMFLCWNPIGEGKVIPSDA